MWDYMYDILVIEYDYILFCYVGLYLYVFYFRFMSSVLIDMYIYGYMIIICCIIFYICNVLVFFIILFL